MTSPVKHIPWLRLAAVGGVIALLSLLGNTLWAALQAGVSLLGLGLTALIGWASVRCLPYLAERLERRLLRARLAAAREAPMEELTVQLLQRGAQLERYHVALAEVGTQIVCMRDMLAQRRAAAPLADTERQAAALDKMKRFHAHHMQNLAEAEAALVAYEAHLAEKRFEWNFAQAGARVLEHLRGQDRESILRDLQRDEATHAVHAGMSRVFATLEAELEGLQAGSASARRLSGQP